MMKMIIKITFFISENDSPLVLNTLKLIFIPTIVKSSRPYINSVNPSMREEGEGREGT